MIQRKRGLFAVALLTLVIALVVTFPARVAYRWAGLPFVALSGIEGTVWKGQAREFSTNGIYLTDLNWQIRPFGLLTGQARYAISGTPVSGFLESEVDIGLDGNVTLTDLTASLPLQMIENAANIRGLRGNASLKIDRLELAAGKAIAVDGTLQVANLVVPLVHRGSLGGYKAEFFTQNNGVVASVEDTDGVVDLAGSLQLAPDGSYSFVGQVVAKPDAPEALKQQMKFLGPANERGQHELRLEGSY